MTGAYLRVKRDGKWEAIEVEHLTDEEREDALAMREPKALLPWINMLCRVVAETERQLMATYGTGGHRLMSLQLGNHVI